MFRPKRERIKSQSFNRMIPNILTMLALCAGLTALKFGLEEKWEAAVISIVVAAVLDALDAELQGSFAVRVNSVPNWIASQILLLSV